MTSRIDRAGVRDELRQSAGIYFEADFHTLTSSQVEALVAKAREVGYRKPRAANGSTGRYFFAYLNRKDAS